jgi:large subunit ribosomal protein L15
MRTMATTAASSARVLFEALRPVRTRPTCQCIRITPSSQRTSQRRRNVSTASAQLSEMEVDTPKPRWAQTPPAMKAPFSLRPRSLTGRHDVNKDPRRLDDMYTKFLGRDGPSLLSDETKWLAVTHKSFDHGRRGFNDRLAYFGRCSRMCRIPSLTWTGKRIVELQASLGILSISRRKSGLAGEALAGVESLTEEAKLRYTFYRRIAHIGELHGLPEVIRWVPRIVRYPRKHILSLANIH